jgi:hypothetical protein
MPQVLPVFLSALPLKSDFTENETVFKCLIGLVKSKNPVVQEHMLQIVQVCAHCMTDQYEIDEELQVHVAEEMRGLCAEFRDSMGPLIAQLPAEYKVIASTWLQ